MSDSHHEDFNSSELRTDRVMVDIETLGTEPGCAILSIGAVRFGPGRLGDVFERSISVESCQDWGLDIDAGTLEWWLSQESEAQQILTGGGTLDKSLLEFSRFYNGADEIWAFSPSFDCEILKAAYDAIDEEPPWSYRDERCARTIASLPIAFDGENQGTDHDALDDAKYQANMVAGTLKKMEGAR